MPSVTIRKIPDETHRALKMRAVQHGRSAEAEIRAILIDALRPKFGMGNALAAIGQGLGGAELDLTRDPAPVNPAAFE